MPDDDRLSRLVDALSGALSQEKLEFFAREFEGLAQDRPQTLTFFVLQHVCQRLASALEGEAVSVERNGATGASGMAGRLGSRPGRSVVAVERCGMQPRYNEMTSRLVFSQ